MEKAVERAGRSDTIDVARYRQDSVVISRLRASLIATPTVMLSTLRENFAEDDRPWLSRLLAWMEKLCRRQRCRRGRAALGATFQ